MAAAVSSRYEMGQTTRSEWETDMRAHRELLRNVIDEHREGRDAVGSWGDMPIDELAFEEETVYAPISALQSSYPPAAAQGPSGWIYHSTSLGCLRPHHFPRRIAINVVESTIFDPFILLTIMCNCITMAWASPMDPPGTTKQDILAVLEWVYLYIFTFELTMKIIAYGFIGHKHSYIRDAWCQLDFVVVSLAWLPILFPEAFGNMNAIRSVRALRPLRALKRVPGMPVLIGSILQSLPALGNVAALSAFLFLIFGIIGMNLFKGLLHYRCADLEVYSTPGLPDPPKTLIDGANAEQGARRHLANAGAIGNGSFEEAAVSLAAGAVTSLAAASMPHLEKGYAAITKAVTTTPANKRRMSGRALKGGGGGGGEADPDDPEGGFDTETLCAADPSICLEDGTSCYYFSNNPGGGTISFDTVPMSFIAILQAVTFDTWTDPMFDIMDSYTYSSWIYFILVAILGGLFVVNLFLAVIFDEFIRAQEMYAQEAELKAEKEAAEKAAAQDELNVDIEEVAALIKANKEMSDGTIKEEKGMCDCAPGGGWRLGLGEIMTGEIVNNISTGFVVFNLVIMCMPYYHQPQDYADFVEGLGTFVTWVFIVEMFLKLIGLGCAAYWSDGWNMLDGIIVSLSIGEMLITVLLADTGVNISFLRMLRLLRLLRLLKAWPGLYKIVMAFVKAIPQISNLFVLMFLLMFIFALLGMQAFGGTGISEDSRWHFDYFYSGMLAVFGIFTGAWVDAFQACADATGVTLAIAYFVPGLIIGFFIVMNLFIAILLEAFVEEEEEEEEPEEEGGEEAAEERPASPSLGVVPSTEAALEPLEGTSLFCLPPESGLRLACQKLAESAAFDQFIIVLIIASSICLALDVPRLDQDSDLKKYLIILNYWFTGLFIFEMTIKIIAYSFITAPKAYIKSGWNILDFVIVMISILGLFADLIPAFGKLKSLRILRVLRPLRLLQRNPGMKLIISSLVQTLPSVVEVFAVTLVFHIVFTIIGMQAFGGAFGSCTNEDITTEAECFPTPDEITKFPHLYPKLYAAQQAGAPIEGMTEAAVVAQAERRKLLENTSGAWLWSAPEQQPAAPMMLAASAAPLDSLDTVANAVMATSTTKEVRMVPASSVSKGAEGMITEEEAERRRNQIRRGRALNAARKEMATREGREARKARRGRALKGGGGGDDDGEELPTEWLNPPFGSFDDFKSSMLILYIAATGDGWEEFMWSGMDATGPGTAPERNDFSAASTFFLAWMIVGCFISLNLFVGAIVDNFTRIKQESDGSATMTPEQQQWVAALKETVSNNASVAPREPTNPAQKWAFGVVQSRTFDFTVISVILLNVFCMALDYHRIDEDEPWNTYYNNLMMFFSYFYYCECALKIFGLRKYYFIDGWCRFDFFLVCTSLADQFFADLLAEYLPVPPTILRVMRVARVLRVLRLLKGLKGVRDLVMTLVFAFPGLMNVGALLLLVMFMFAVFGMNVFTFLAHGDAINEDRNFETFGNAMLLLFQCLTGDGWSEMMDDALITEERGCDPYAVPTDCGSALSVPYFIIYTILGTFVMLNLVVAVRVHAFLHPLSSRTSHTLNTLHSHAHPFLFFPLL